MLALGINDATSDEERQLQCRREFAANQAMANMLTLRDASPFRH